MKLRGHIAKGRSCWLHGDNGCENQGQAGSISRAKEKAQVKQEVNADQQSTSFP